MIRNTKYESMGISIDGYNSRRNPEALRNLKTLCHAPFVSMDFGPQGQISVCNHYYQSIANYHEAGSILEVWHGRGFADLRKQMLSYIIDEDRCRHCALQFRTGKPDNSFAIEQYDFHAADSTTPPYPQLLTFRLHNTCNLACIMCTGDLSSRIQTQRERRKASRHVYDERFFTEIREILPHAKHVEFFGGEPFLIDEHRRIFQMLVELGATCSIYINTNAMSLNERSKPYLERLNFTCIAVSMDAINDKLHSKIRIGINSDKFRSNLRWLLDLRKRKALNIILNVTEMRQNWFELPEIFVFAAQNDCHLHINTCLHPPHCSLYNLPPDELRYVHEYLEQSKQRILSALTVRGNDRSYDHLLMLVQTSLSLKQNEESTSKCVVLDPRLFGTDGLMASPIPGLAPFETPVAVLAEVERISHHVDGFGARLLQEMRSQAALLRPIKQWQAVLDRIDSIVAIDGQQDPSCKNGQDRNKLLLTHYFGWTGLWCTARKGIVAVINLCKKISGLSHM
jgi:sulfatase maturation enzyme AslB (radical SAM superfamily)